MKEKNNIPIEDRSFWFLKYVSGEKQNLKAALKFHEHEEVGVEWIEFVGVFSTFSFKSMGEIKLGLKDFAIFTKSINMSHGSNFNKHF